MQINHLLQQCNFYINRFKQRIKAHDIYQRFLVLPNHDLKTYILHHLLNRHNIDIIKKTKICKSIILKDITDSHTFFKFKDPIECNNSLLFHDLKDYLPIIMTNSRYSFIIENNSILGVVNLDDDRICTLSQFKFFGKTIESHLKNNDLNLKLHRPEIIRLFRDTHISIFKCVYFLYEAKLEFLAANTTFNIIQYASFIINHMASRGHIIRTSRDRSNHIIFINL